LDVNADGRTWYFDPTPEDDAEFTALVNSGSTGLGTAFYSSFVDASQTAIHDFYDTVLHEIGHAVGMVSSVESWLGYALSLTTFTDDPLSTNPIHRLYTYTGTTVSATITTAGGAHFYEGTVANPVHPNELMNSGRTFIFGSSPFIPTVRRQISDLTVRVLADAYGYGVTLPSTLNTAHVTLDSQTGTLLVHGGVTHQNFGQNDDIIIDTVIEDSVTMVRVQVDDTSGNRPTMEKVRLDQVSQIVIVKYGGVDIIQVAPALQPLVKEVFYAVSTNQDSANAGVVGDYLIDLDPAVPGVQIPLRAAIVETNSVGDHNPPLGIYVPRGHYRLTIAGTGSISQGDLDIAESVVIVGTGAGETIIDAGGASGIGDRVFDVTASASLGLDRLTVTGGYLASGSGAGVRVADLANLTVTDSAFVGNNAVTGAGGAILRSDDGNTTIRRSVFTGNNAGTNGGAIRSNG
jgi:hypothetical protein